MERIATIRCGFTGKFGIPRQSGLVEQARGRIVFEPQYRDANALRGLEEFSHIWLIWEFSQAIRQQWSPTVRPPRLGGNTRMGVFATRSPFRPNPIGLSCVRLERIDLHTTDGPVLIVSGADLMDGTPIYDIKPYITYADCRPEAKGGFTDRLEMQHLSVSTRQILEAITGPQHMDAATLQAIAGILEQDPRPRYQADPDRVYSFEYAGWNISFKVDGCQTDNNQAATVTVVSVTRQKA